MPAQPILRSFAELETLLGRMAAQDPGFRARLVADPKQVFAESFGVDLPAQLRFQVHEAPADTVVVVLPALREAGELSDAELEGLAGGVTGQGPEWWRTPHLGQIEVRPHGLFFGQLG